MYSSEKQPTRKLDIYEQVYVDGKLTRSLQKIGIIEIPRTEKIEDVEKRLSLKRGIRIYLRPYTRDEA